MRCPLCHENHELSQCPRWRVPLTSRKAMKRTLLALAAAASLSGCAGLHVSWTATASYNMPTAVQAGIIQPGKLPGKP